MGLWNVLFFVRKDNETTEALADVWGRVKEFKDFVISTLEAVIILGALKAATSISKAPLVLEIMFLIGWLALGLYLLTGMKLFFAVWIDERGPDPYAHPRARWFLEKVVFSIITAVVAMSIPYLLPTLISAVIENQLIN